MLEHETEQTPGVLTSSAQIPAAERRVSAEELTRAVSALEDAKAAERIAGVAPIGQVVDELGLDSTPEEIWAEVQHQRAQKAVVKTPFVQANVALPALVRHRWRWFILAGVSAAVLGHFFVHDVPTPPVAITSVPPITAAPVPPVTATNLSPDVVIKIRGSGNIITLPGKARSVVTVNGNNNKVTGGSSDGNMAWWTPATPVAKTVPKPAHEP